MTSLSRLANGYYTLPVGKLANAVTWLELRKLDAVHMADPLRLVDAVATDRETCRLLFADIGTPWLWSQAYDDPARTTRTTLIAYADSGERVGLVELSQPDAGSVEIVYFGLAPTATGRGLGRRLMAAVLDRCWRSADRVWLHTCNFDHPAALRFYRSCGFTPYATGFEIMDDPRLDGRLPPGAAPHVPLIEAGIR